ncbi:hypothetical protein CDAR_311371 [Caerostris darwini]|uniref:Uncharacterized protein n=1 Tax=Caerostris darwini TaxID=1538125 RepID=A0AAV4UUG6_9ARAC|nr:hypothetical protein CDAR_311371 [Caerostris darwini]
MQFGQISTLRANAEYVGPQVICRNGGRRGWRKAISETASPVNIIGGGDGPVPKHTDNCSWDATAKSIIGKTNVSAPWAKTWRSDEVCSSGEDLN